MSPEFRTLLMSSRKDSFLIWGEMRVQKLSLDDGPWVLVSLDLHSSPILQTIPLRLREAQGHTSDLASHGLGLIPRPALQWGL